MRLITDDSLCRDCQACTLACSLAHEGECGPSLARLRVLKDMEHYAFHIVTCRHCAAADPAGGSGAGPDCVVACPNEALRPNAEGIPVLYEEECLLCGACAEACPYQAIFYDGRRDRYLKCDLCSGQELGPLCVAVCPVGAIVLHEA